MTKGWRYINKCCVGTRRRRGRTASQRIVAASKPNGTVSRYRRALIAHQRWCHWPQLPERPVIIVFTIIIIIIYLTYRSNGTQSYLKYVIYLPGHDRRGCLQQHYKNASIKLKLETLVNISIIHKMFIRCD